MTIESLATQRYQGTPTERMSTHGQLTFFALNINDSHLVGLSQKQPFLRTEVFEYLMRRYESLVFRRCYKLIGNQEDAREACQDIFLRVFRSLSRFERRSSFRTWLFRVATNVCLTYRAKLARQYQREMEYIKVQRQEEKAADAWCESSVQATRTRVTESLRHLSREDRRILTLRYLADYSFAEIAETQGLSLSAAKMRLYRATKHLRQRYLHPGQGGG